MDNELQKLLYHKYLVKQQQRKLLSIDDFLGFITYVKKDYIANWHHVYLANKLQQFAHGKIKRLMVFMPPRSGKSEQVSRHLPAFILGHYPDRKIIASSYADSLASAMNRDVQRVMDNENYIELFPETRLNYDNSRSQITYLRNNDVFEIVGHRGQYRSCGVGGGLTGHGADYIILDDPIKNAEQASSATYREKTFEWFQSTLYTRSEGQGCILITLTRWHEQDLAGMLLEQAKNDPDADQWEVISFPSIKEDETNNYDIRNIGEALWPEKYNLSKLSKIKKALGTKYWNALHQQTPSAMEGNIVKKIWWKFYETVPQNLDQIWQSWDLTFDETEKGSYVVGTVWGKKRENHYLIDIYRDRCGFNEQLKMIRNAKSQYPDTTRILVEKKANGSALINTLKDEIAGIIPVEPHGSKTMRAESVCHIIESGNVWLPNNKSWVQDYIDEHTNFPNGKNDDQVDSTSQYLFEAKGKISVADVL